MPLLFLVYVAGLATISTFLSIFLVRERGLDATIVGVWVRRCCITLSGR